MVVDKPLVSVIMPAFNAEAYIKEAIQSILDQTYPNFELLICDDGSSDKTVEVVDSFNDDRIKLFIKNKNLGNLKTTNFLFSKCKGEFITIQDADDYSQLNRFELLLKAFNEDKELGMVGSNYLAISFDGEGLFSGNLPLTNEETTSVLKKEVIPMLYASVMVKKAVFDTVKPFPVFFNRKGYADFDWMARIQEKTRVKNLKEILYVYRRHPFSFTSKKSNVKFKDTYHELIVQMHLRRLASQEDYFESNNIFQIRKMISNIYLRRAIQKYWDKTEGVNELFFKSFISFPLNIQMIKTFIYTLRKK